MAVAAVGVILNALTVLLFAAGRKHDLNIRGAFLHMAADAAVSLGVVISGWMVLVTGRLWLDPAASLLVGAVVVWSTWGLLQESLRLAMDAVPRGMDVHVVERYLASLLPSTTSTSGE